MKALIIKKKWLDLILSGEKTWEMRSRNTKVRGRIALVESGSGLIKGEVTLWNSFSLEAVRNKHGSRKSYKSYEDECHRIKDSKLLKKYNQVWQLDAPKKYAIPIRYNHPKGAVIWINNIEERIHEEDLIMYELEINFN